ncbi:MAG: AAA family ATPase [Calditerrivibrio sp.]|nr:AAA family ATPase [Calditerrivibrio sp.]
MSELSPNALILKDIIKPDKIIETHISYVFVKDDFVYKLKKAVNFGFLDFTLAQYRRSYCYLEKELNERFSKGIYLDLLKIVRKNKSFDLVPITSTLPTVDYVLKMKRIDNKNFFSTRLKNNEISEELAFDIGKQIALLFKNINTNSQAAGENGSYEIIKKNCLENFEQTEKYIDKYISRSDYDFIKQSTIRFLEENRELFEKRLKEGFIIDGHGDLRTEHVYFDGDKIGLIDCIEFNKRFRYNDVVSDFVFLCMETDYDGRIDISDALLKGFLTVYDDNNTKKLINFYKCYRAYVRFKVGCFMLDDKDESWEFYTDKLNEVKKMSNLSLSYALNMFETKAIIFYGTIASGKSKNSKFFSDRFASKYVNSDILRKRLAGIEPYERVLDDYNQGLYSKEMSFKVYKNMGELAKDAVNISRMIVVDASFAKKEFLEIFSRSYGGQYFKVKCFAPENIVYERMKKRFEKDSASDGRPEIYEKQKKEFQDIGADIEIETIGDLEDNIQIIVEKLKQKIRNEA